jgi:hypothetical protein
VKQHYVQAGILVLSLVTAFLMTSKTPRSRCYGCVTGFVTQPLWCMAAWDKGQWGIFLLSFWYAFCYLRGFFGNRDQIT